MFHKDKQQPNELSKSILEKEKSSDFKNQKKHITIASKNHTHANINSKKPISNIPGIGHQFHFSCTQHRDTSRTDQHI